MSRFDLLVVGSGVIGLSAAWRRAVAGQRVALFDPHPSSGASYAAAGMLAPVSEATFGEEALFELCRRSLGDWPSFAAEVEAASGLGVGLRDEGTLLVAADAADRGRLEQLADYHARHGLISRLAVASRCRELEPLLAPAIAGGLEIDGDLQVDNRRLLAALAVAAQRAGVRFVAERCVEVIEEGGVACGVRSVSGEWRAPQVLLASGTASGALAPAVLPEIRAVTGQILRLRSPSVGLELARTLRGTVQGNEVYLVPRRGGRLVLGATVEEQPTEALVTVGGTYQLLRDATRLVPALKEYELLETLAARRPGSPDNLPLIGATLLPGCFVATGHHRNGILLAPLTARLLDRVLEGEAPPDWARPLSPGRFAPAGVAR